MIQVVFEFGGSHVGVEVNGETVSFYDFTVLQHATIDGLKLNYEGVIKEHPDLKDNPEWRKIAIQRFKDYIKNLPSENARVDYLINDLKKWGYKPLYKQKMGFRPEKIK